MDNKYLLEKCSGKDAWTYTVIPEIPPDRKAQCGWVKVKGSIDGFEIEKIGFNDYVGRSLRVRFNAAKAQRTMHHTKIKC